MLTGCNLEFHCLAYMLQQAAKTRVTILAQYWTYSIFSWAIIIIYYFSLGLFFGKRSVLQQEFSN